MGIGTSIFLFAIGAILRFAVNVQTDGFNLHNVGVILMIVGLLGGLLSLMFWGSWGGFGRAPYTEAPAAYADDEVVIERPVRRRRTVMIERERRV